MATCLVFPSLFEGAGLPVIEAMEQGLPVACSRIPPLVEYAGDAASFFDPEDVEAIADSLLRLTEDNEGRADLRERGLRQARRFTMARMAERHQQIYRLAATRGPSSEA
jgi:glycosyltransferase involved in cell wall biosynthesis